MAYLGTAPAKVLATTEQIGDGAVQTADIANDAVTTAKILNANVTQAKLGANVAGTGAAFSAYLSANQTVSSNTYTKLALNTEEFDTNSCYDTTLYRFTPIVAGYYQVNGSAYSSGGAILIAVLFKNGALNLHGTDVRTSAAGYGSLVSTITYLNGTTDYLELYTYSTNTTMIGSLVGGACRFSAAMVRGA